MLEVDEEDFVTGNRTTGDEGKSWPLPVMPQTWDDG